MDASSLWLVILDRAPVHCAIEFREAINAAFPHLGAAANTQNCHDNCSHETFAADALSATEAQPFKLSTTLASNQSSLARRYDFWL
eukprot:2967213-Amphidinium_carterae.1